MQLQRQMIAYSRMASARQFDRDFTLNVSNILTSPIYQIPSIVPEIITAIMLNGGGYKIYDSVRPYMDSNRSAYQEVLLPFNGHDDLFKNGELTHFTVNFCNSQLPII